MKRSYPHDAEMAEELALEGLVIAGTELAFEVLGPMADDPSCIRCGAPISYVMVTNKGPMGGDCYATLTGDDSTRKVWRKILKNVEDGWRHQNGNRWLAVEVEFAGGGRPRAWKLRLRGHEPGVRTQRTWWLGELADKDMAIAVASQIADDKQLALDVLE